MAQTTDKNNIQSIQFLRGIAASIVMLCHTNECALPKNDFFIYFFPYGYVGVYVFFIISGFIIPYSMYQNGYKVSDFKNLMLRRIVRIEPPYLICIIFIILFHYLNYFTASTADLNRMLPIQWGNVLGHIGYINAFTHQSWLSPVFWTLAIEFEYYVLIGLMFPLVTSDNKVTLWLAHILLLCSFKLTPILNAHYFNIQETYIFFFIPIFLIGIALFLKRVNKITNMELIIMVTLDMVIAFNINYGVNAYIVLALCVLSLLSIQFIKTVPKMFLWLGTISYSLYLTHALVISRVVVLLGKITNKRYLDLRVTLSIIASFGVAYVYYLLFEKPFFKLSKKIKIHKK